METTAYFHLPFDRSVNDKADNTFFYAQLKHLITITAKHIDHY